MQKDELFQKLTQLFASRINYDGEFNSLFLIETEQGELKINFLNKQHYHYIMLNLKREVLKITGTNVKFGYMNMKTSAISLKNIIRPDNIHIVKPAPIKPKENVELPTIKNRTLQKVVEYLYDEFDNIEERLKEIKETKENYKEDKWYYFNHGQIHFIVGLYQWINENKDYDDE